jgi:hypothetical protein
MSASAHGGNHDQAFYEAAIEETFEAAAATGVLTPFNADTDGALAPGRWLVQVRGLAATQEVWVHVGPFVAGTPLAPVAPTAAGTKRFPLTSSIVGLEFHVLNDYSDRVAVQLNSGASVACFLSRVSTRVQKSNRRA